MAKFLKTKPHPPFGATPAQARKYKILRDHKNEIFRLQQEHEAELAKVRGALQDAEREVKTLRMERDNLRAAFSAATASLDDARGRLATDSQPAWAAQLIVDVVRVALATGKTTKESV